MPTPTKAAKITCEVYKSIGPQAEAALRAMRADHAHVHSRRAVVLRERAPLPLLPPRTGLEEDPAEVYEVYLPRAQARGAVLAWARELRLFTPGRGTIYAEEVEILNPPGLEFCNTRMEPAETAQRPGERLAPLVLVNCVVQRGHGNEIARCALEMGASVPSVNFGIGTGVRNRLGLLRIAIPAEKEIVSLLVDAQDQEEIFDGLIEAGRLDQPGRGFIAAYPVAFGIGNPKSFRGPRRYSASMEQVILAIDELKTGAEWRRRSGAGAGEGAARKRKGSLTDLVNFSLVCNEGSSDRLVSVAMNAGAGGATISKAKHFSPSGEDYAVSPGREIIDLGIRPEKVDSLIRALGDGGAFEAEATCMVEMKPLPTAFTYVVG